MLHATPCSDNAEIQNSLIPPFIQRLGTLFDAAFHPYAFLARGFHFEKFRDFFQSLYLSLSLFQMVLKSLLERGIVRTFRHLRNGFRELPFSRIEILDFVFE